MTRRRISLVKLARRGRDPQKGLSILPRGDQVTRQWHLIRLLTGKYGRTLAQLRSELGVTKRTVQRDIADLERAGFPVISEERNGTVFWHFMEGFHAEGQGRTDTYGADGALLQQGNVSAPARDADVRSAGVRDPEDWVRITGPKFRIPARVG